MVVVDKPPKNGFVRVMRKVYNPLGFSKGYNALLWFIFDGALFGFVLARFNYINIFGVFCPPSGGGGGVSAAPGECYWYSTFPRNRIGIILHLGTILPAALLAVFQFVPIIRYKAMIYHRIAGYVIMLLVLVSNAGSLMIANHTFGGEMATQMFIGFLVLITFTSFLLSYINIKRLQIDQHRAWMLRAWFYMASIITLRLIQILAVMIQAQASSPPVYAIQDCKNMLFEYKKQGSNSAQLYLDYPACNPANSQWAMDGQVIVRASFAGTDPMMIGSALAINFGAAGWLALAMHAIGVELYLNLTPRENNRLRQVSFQRQLEAGYSHPGSSGIVAERLGDSQPWMPEITQAKQQQYHPSPSVWNTRR